jgi:hypothetical protein
MLRCLSNLIVGLWLGASLLAAEAPKETVIDDCESLAASRETWQMTGVKAELSSEHVTGGKSSLKLTFAGDGALQLNLPGKSADWSKFKALRFDVFNPQDTVVELGLRIDDAPASGFKDRFEPCGQMWLAPKRATRVEIMLDDLQASINFRLMDTAQITRFSFHPRAKGEVMLYVDSFGLTPLPPEELARQVPPATEPLVLDDAAAPEKSKALWQASEAQFEVSGEHVPDGQHSLKVTFPAGEGWPEFRAELQAKPMDWRPYTTLEFEAYNPADGNMSIGVRVDAVNSIDKYGRFMVNEIALPARSAKTVQIDIARMAGLGGIKLDKSRIVLLCIFTYPSKQAQVAFFSNIRLGIGAGGLKNEIQPGRIPGKNPEILGKEMLEDPEIKPLSPIFKALPKKRVAICSHSASMSSHWSTSAGFIDIAMEAVKAVNTNFEYQGFHQGGMLATTAAGKFLKPMQDYKPTDTYLLVLPDGMAGMQQLIAGMKAAGSRVFVFDPIKPWGTYYAPDVTEALRKLSQEHTITFIELMERGWGAPGSYKWTTSDTTHMTTAGHIFYAREFLKELAKTYGPPGKTK